MSIIGIIFLITFVVLLIKAILETIWGGCLLMLAAFWFMVAALLGLADAVVTPIAHFFQKRKLQKKRSKRQPPMAGAISFR